MNYFVPVRSRTILLGICSLNRCTCHGSKLKVKETLPYNKVYTRCLTNKYSPKIHQSMPFLCLQIAKNGLNTSNSVQLCVLHKGQVCQLHGKHYCLNVLSTGGMLELFGLQNVNLSIAWWVPQLWSFESLRIKWVIHLCGLPNVSYLKDAECNSYVVSVVWMC